LILCKSKSWILFFLIQFFRFESGVAQCDPNVPVPLPISYNPLTNLLSVDFPFCDPCTFNSLQEVQKCNCIKNCVIETKADPNNICSWLLNSNGAAYYNWCIHGHCVQNCGGESLVRRHVVAFRAREFAFHAPIGSNPFDFPVATINDIPFHPASFVQINPWLVNAPWPGIYSTENTCYVVVIIVLYNDNTQAQFIGQLCHITG
jgi:hypothetical protein